MVGIGGVGPGGGAGGGGAVGGTGRGVRRGSRGVAGNKYRRTIYHFKYHIGTYLSIHVALLMGLEHHHPTMSTLWGHGGWSKRERR